VTGDESTFVADRLEFARKRQAVSKTALAMDVGVSQKSIQRWESGEVVPGAEQQDELASALGVNPSFFSLPELEALPVAAVSFRALTKMTAGERDSARYNGRLGVEFFRWFESKFGLPPLDVPQVPELPPEVAADYVRKSWDLGTKPVGHLVAQLELHGVRVLALPSVTRSVDAFSFYFEGKAYVFLDTSKSAERLRFDAAHELGHLVLHADHEEPHGKAAEAAAQAFASAFLMPRESVLAAGLRDASAERVIKAKAHWKISAMALAYRLREVGLLTEWGYRSLCIDLAKLGFRRGEPGSNEVHESSQVLAKVITGLRKQGLSQRDVGNVFGLPLEEFSEFLLGLTMTPLRSSQ
jgi:Zn-dependent peptidase ImmA (M78 family)